VPGGGGGVGAGLRTVDVRHLAELAAHDAEERRPLRVVQSCQVESHGDMRLEGDCGVGVDEDVPGGVGGQ
jgi:hypothetical protein